MSLIPHSRPPAGWMSVYETDNSPDAYIVVGRLETEGIKSWVYQEAAGSAMGITIGPLGAVLVLVNPDDYERAMSILAEDLSDEDWLDGDELTDEDGDSDFE